MIPAFADECGNPACPSMQTHETGIIPGLANPGKCKLNRTDARDNFTVFHAHPVNYEFCITEKTRISTHKDNYFFILAQGNDSCNKQLVVFVKRVFNRLCIRK